MVLVYASNIPGVPKNFIAVNGKLTWYTNPLISPILLPCATVRSASAADPVNWGISPGSPPGNEYASKKFAGKLLTEDWFSAALSTESMNIVIDHALSARP